MQSSNASGLHKSGNASKMSTDSLRSFYFSGATNYNSYKKKSDGSSPTRQSTTSTAATHQDVVPLTSNSLAGADTEAAPQLAGGSALSAIKQQSGSAGAVAVGHSADAVSPEYIAFLRQQQDLVKVHGHVGDVLAGMLDAAGKHREMHRGDALMASDMLGVAEGSTNWNWKSKFTLDGLVRDAELAVPENDLRQPDAIPRVVDLQHQHQQLVKLRKEHFQGDSSAALSLVLDNGIRRFDRLLKEFGDSQLDAGPVTALSDNLVVQLDHVLAVPPLQRVLQEVDDTLAIIEGKQKQCMALRLQALEDGEMNVAERESYRLVDLSEELSAAQLERIRLLNSVSEEHAVSSAVRDAYYAKASDDSSQLELEQTDLKQRCLDDLAKLYALKRQVDDTEGQMRGKWDAERAQSDSRLGTINARQTEAWDQIEMLTKQLVQLEAERHSEYKRRIDEKVRDESRRNECAVFTGVAEDHAATLDRTVKNCDINIHCAKLMHEFLSSGFNSIQKQLAAYKAEVDGELLGAHKRHLDIFRGLLFTLGDLEYKKGKRIDEVSGNVQAAHIQQELCSDSLNPNAKKFSDAKKDLLRLRDELDLEVSVLRERQQTAVDHYAPTGAALVAAEFPHVHPVEELKDWQLDMRARMVEYRAMSLGNVPSKPLASEISALQQSLNESRQTMESRNESRSQI